MIDTTVPHSAGVWNYERGDAMDERTRRNPGDGPQSRGDHPFFDGLELLEPGVVSLPLWRPDSVEVGAPAEVSEFCGVARKP